MQTNIKLPLISPITFKKLYDPSLCLSLEDNTCKTQSTIIELFSDTANRSFCCYFVSVIVVSLPARTSILAAANPVGGHYNKAKTVSENLK